MSRMFYIFLFTIFSTKAFSNTYANCSVDSLYTNESAQNLVVVTLGCTASDAFASGGNCTVAPRSNAFLFDPSTANGKANLSLLLTALSAGNTVTATTYGACVPAMSDTLILYSLKLSKK